MLNEKRITDFTYDPSLDMVTLVIDGRTGAANEKRQVAASLLLDEQGYLVGVDVEPEGAGRIVAMLGSHEDVARTRDARVELAEDGAGTLSRIEIQTARLIVRANEKNPYLHRSAL